MLTWLALAVRGAKEEKGCEDGRLRVLRVGRCKPRRLGLLPVHRYFQA